MRRDSLACPYCRIGRLDLRRANVIHFYNGLLVCAPNTPAWECDICRYREFDANVLRRISLLVQRDLPLLDQHRPTRPHQMLGM
ncbi:MAG: hypothetical protein RML95_11955 [Anaerolineae bacterium]|nr:hypothetical protein [Anaerolineae bacterium]MDW8300037.1 hypothetical protein [Anaerolineae bacterium]